MYGEPYLFTWRNYFIIRYAPPPGLLHLKYANLIIKFCFSFVVFFVSFDGHSYPHYFFFYNFHPAILIFQPDTCVLFCYPNYCLPQSMMLQHVCTCCNMQASLVQEIILEIYNITPDKTRQQIKINHRASFAYRVSDCTKQIHVARGGCYGVRCFWPDFRGVENILQFNN